MPGWESSRLAATAARSNGGQFILHAKALPRNPYDGHTLETILPGIEATTGAALSRIPADAAYKGHNAPEKLKLKVYTQGQKRRVTDAHIKGHVPGSGVTPRSQTAREARPPAP